MRTCTFDIGLSVTILSTRSPSSTCPHPATRSQESIEARPENLPHHLLLNLIERELSRIKVPTFVIPLLFQAIVFLRGNRGITTPVHSKEAVSASQRKTQIFMCDDATT